MTIGVAGETHSPAGPLGAALRARLPLVTVNAGAVNFVAGTKDAPFELELRVELDWSVAKGQTIGLTAIRAWWKNKQRATQEIISTFAITPAFPAEINLPGICAIPCWRNPLFAS